MDRVFKMTGKHYDLLLILMTFIYYVEVTTTSELEKEKSFNLKKSFDTNNDLLQNSNVSSLITSISVILHDNKPQFANAIGQAISKPSLPLQVASPINLLNPDRYEFYTFNENGELIKRLMTLKEIQSIVANGDGGNIPTLQNIKINNYDPEKNIYDIVASVQNVLTKEIEWNKNTSKDNEWKKNITVFDTPDVSASWSMILPNIFSNAGSESYPSKPQQLLMTPDAYVLETSTKSIKGTTSYANISTQEQKLSTNRNTLTESSLSPDSVKSDLSNFSTNPSPTTIKSVSSNTAAYINSFSTTENPFMITLTSTKPKIDELDTKSSVTSNQDSFTMTIPSFSAIPDVITTTSSPLILISLLPLSKITQQQQSIKSTTEVSSKSTLIFRPSHNTIPPDYVSTEESDISSTENDNDLDKAKNNEIESISGNEENLTEMLLVHDTEFNLTLPQTTSKLALLDSVKTTDYIQETDVTNESSLENQTPETTISNTLDEDQLYVFDLKEDNSTQAKLENATLIEEKNYFNLSDDYFLGTEEKSDEIVTSTRSSIKESNFQTNESFLTESESSNEIEALLSDVISQITNFPTTTFPLKTQVSNRLSNFAQINSAVFLQHDTKDHSNVGISQQTKQTHSSTNSNILPTASSTSNWQFSDINQNLTKTPTADNKTVTEKLITDTFSNKYETEKNDEEESFYKNDFINQFSQQEDFETNYTVTPSEFTNYEDNLNDDNFSDRITTQSIPIDLTEMQYYENTNQSTILFLNDSMKTIKNADKNLETLHNSQNTIFINKQNLSDLMTLVNNFDNISNKNKTEELYIKLGEPTEYQNKKIHEKTDKPEMTNIKIENSTISDDKDKLYNTSAIINSNETVKNIEPLFNKTQIKLPDTEQTSESQIKSNTLKPIQYYKQPGSNEHKLMLLIDNPVFRPSILNNFKNDQINGIKKPDNLDQSSAIEEDTTNSFPDNIKQFIYMCNDLGFRFWKSIKTELNSTRSLILSPFALTSMLSMIFLGARGSTSGEMNEILRLDDMITFNPHLTFKNITESVQYMKNSQIASMIFVREIFSDKKSGKILQFFREKAKQFYSSHIEETNFNDVNDLIKRRTNMLIDKHTMGRVSEYLKTNNIWVNGPLAAISANLFQLNCSEASTQKRDSEMLFQVHSSVRQRRLISIPAVVWHSGFTVGYDHVLDATAAALGSIDDTVTTIFLMPEQRGLAAINDNLDNLENALLDTENNKNFLNRLLTSMTERSGLELQLPRFSHQSFVNFTSSLQKLGLKTLFNAEAADLRGLTRSPQKQVYLSDIFQINTFDTCVEEKLSTNLHVEMFPNPTLKRQNMETEQQQFLKSITATRYGSNLSTQNNARAIYDDLLDPKYLELPLPLRPRQARVPDVPRLRFDKPFMYFVRHNPSGMILLMGRFNPRLLL